MPKWVVESLKKDHDRDEFSSGKAMLDNFIQKLAGQFERRHLCRTYVAVQPGESRVLGYYSVSSLSISISDIPESTIKKLKIPAFPVPCMLLGRLAVDETVQGEGLGKHLLLNALKRSLEIQQLLGVVLVIVHALDDDARQFYQRFGFLSFVTNDHHLFVPMKTVEKLFQD